MSKRTILAAFGAIAVCVAIGLTGCSAGESTAKPSTTASSTPKPMAESKDGKAPKTGVCDNGQMTIVDADLAADRTLVIAKACDLVAVVASDARITLEQDVTTLTVEGSNNTIVGEGIEQSLDMGGSNTVQYTGNAPKKVAGDDDTAVYQQR